MTPQQESELIDNKGETASLDRRVTHIERMTEQLGSTVSDLRAGQASLSSQMTTLMASIDALTGRMNDPANKTSWTAIISAGVAVLVLLGAIGASNLVPLYAANEAMVKQLERLTEVTLTEARTQSQLEARGADIFEWVEHMQDRLQEVEDLTTENSVRSKANEQRINRTNDQFHEALTAK